MTHVPITAEGEEPVPVRAGGRARCARRAPLGGLQVSPRGKGPHRGAGGRDLVEEVGLPMCVGGGGHSKRACSSMSRGRDEACPSKVGAVVGKATPALSAAKDEAAAAVQPAPRCRGARGSLEVVASRAGGVDSGLGCQGRIGCERVRGRSRGWWRD